MPIKTVGAALAALVVIQESLSITSPITQAVVKAFKYVPATPTKNADNYWFQNEATLNPIVRGVNLLIQEWSIHTQFLVKNSDQDIALEIAEAFLNEFLDALNDDVSLGGTVTQANIRGGNPTLATLRSGGVSYQGFDISLDLEMKEGRAFS